MMKKCKKTKNKIKNSIIFINILFLVILIYWLKNTRFFLLNKKAENIIVAQKKSHKLIVGGEPILDKDELPFVVNINNGCTGVLINPNWVLTTAHCVYNIPENYIYVNSIKKSDFSCQNQIKVIKTIFFPKYEEKMELKYDLALLLLEKSFYLKQYPTIPSKLKNEDYLYNKGGSVIVVGWGIKDIIPPSIDPSLLWKYCPSFLNDDECINKAVFYGCVYNYKCRTCVPWVDRNNLDCNKIRKKIITPYININLKPEEEMQTIDSNELRKFNSVIEDSGNNYMFRIKSDFYSQGIIWGDSGGPVLYKKDNQYFIIGINDNAKYLNIVKLINYEHFIKTTIKSTIYPTIFPSPTYFPFPKDKLKYCSKYKTMEDCNNNSYNENGEKICGYHLGCGFCLPWNINKADYSNNVCNCENIKNQLTKIKRAQVKIKIHR